MLSKADFKRMYPQLKKIKGTYFVPADQAREKALRGALRSYAKGCRPEDVLALWDSTVFGGGKSGFLLSRDRLYGSDFHMFTSVTSGVDSFPLDRIKSIRDVNCLDEPGKTSALEISYENGDRCIVYTSTYTPAMLSFLNLLLKLRKELSGPEGTDMASPAWKAGPSKLEGAPPEGPSFSKGQGRLEEPSLPPRPEPKSQPKPAPAPQPKPEPKPAKPPKIKEEPAKAASTRTLGELSIAMSALNHRSKLLDELEEALAELDQALAREDREGAIKAQKRVISRADLLEGKDSAFTKAIVAQQRELLSELENASPQVPAPAAPSPQPASPPRERAESAAELSDRLALVDDRLLECSMNRDRAGTLAALEESLALMERLRALDPARCSQARLDSRRETYNKVKGKLAP